jgi:soluble lytic murein transglycosylase-like protein
MTGKPNFLFPLSLFLIAGLMLPALSQADIYRYVDQDGITHLTNVPTQNHVKYELIFREKRVLFKLNASDINKYDQLITRAAEKYNVDSALVKAVIKAESNFNHQAVSRKGARGLMQLMPATASSLQVQDSFHPENNIDGGVRYLRYLLNVFKGDLSLALAAYNAGEKAVARHHYSIPPYRETQTYVQRVLTYLDHYQQNGSR